MWKDGELFHRLEKSKRTALLAKSAQSPQPPPATFVRPQSAQQVTTSDAQRRPFAVLRPGFAWVSRKKLEAMQHSAERGRPGGDRERVDLKQLEERRRRRLLLRKLIDPAVEEAVSDTRFAVRNRPAEIPRQPPPAFRPPQSQPRPPTLRPPPQVRPPQRSPQPAPRPQPAITVLTARQSPVNTQNRPPQPQAPPPQARPTPPPALPPPNQRLRAPPPQQIAPQNVNTAAGIDRRSGAASQLAVRPPSPKPPPPSQSVQVGPPRQLQISRNSIAAPAPSPPTPPVETQSKPASGKTGPHPPGFLPPSNSIIEQLNSADNFMDVAERLQLKRLLINRSRRHTEFVVHRQKIMLASTPAPLVPKLIIGPEIPEKFSAIPVKNITKTVWRMPLTMTLQQKLTIMPKDKQK
ncbi:hypothetical protein Ddc_04268 [Ditylenchus destructor]|nr:hypothetical protein Ddc_04268 [Ditylenchus destructor]